MGWTAPRTWADGSDTPDAAMLEAHIRGNIMQLPHVLIVKTMDQSFSDNVDGVPDDELWFDAEVGETWYVRGVILFFSSTAADYKFGYDAPTVNGPALGSRSMVSTVDLAGLPQNVVLYKQPGFFRPGLGEGVNGILEFWLDLRVGETAGRFQILSAQSTADPEDTTVLAGSHFEAWRYAA